MARKSVTKKFTTDVAKFGGEDRLGKVVMDGNTHDVASLETKSETRLEDDRGEGNVNVIRKYTFKANPKAFHQHQPTKQDLFNHHLKGIEISLWKDGMQFNTDIEPQLHFDEKKAMYHIFVGAKVARGHIVPYQIMDADLSLSKVVHG